MAKEDSHYRDQFCRTMILQISCTTDLLISSTNNMLSYYKETDRPDVLVKITNKTRKTLLKSKFRDIIPFTEIQSDLYQSMKQYYNHNITCYDMGILHCKSPLSGKDHWQLVGGILVENMLHGFSGKNTHFNFASLAISKPMIQYLAHCMLLIELNHRLENKNPGATICPGDSTAPGDSMITCLFNTGGYELFCYLNENYSPGNKCLPAKFSYLYHFLKHENRLVGSQAEYIHFISTRMQVVMSKIFPRNIKYDDTVFPLLGRLTIDFEKKNKIVVNRILSTAN